MSSGILSSKRWLLCSGTGLALLMCATSAAAEARVFNIPPQSAETGISAFAQQAGVEVLISAQHAAGRTVRAISGSHDAREGLDLLLKGTGLVAKEIGPTTYTVVPAATVAPAAYLQKVSALQPQMIAASDSEAAEVSAASPNITAPKGPTALGEIVVVATKRLERLENVPASITAVSGSALERAGVTNVADLALIAPGVSLAPSSNTKHPAIRGVTSNLLGSITESNVSTYIDGFYHLDDFDALQDFNNVQDVEILKGPQGTLYGRNASGGAILIQTREPTDTLTFDASARYAPRFNDRAVSVFLAGPLARGISFSLAGGYHEDEGQWTDINDFAPGVPISTQVYSFGGNRTFQPSALEQRGGSNRTAPYQNWSIRSKLLFEVTPDIKVELIYAHNHLSDASSLARRSDTGGTTIDADFAPEYNGYPVATAIDTTSLSFRPINLSDSNEVAAKLDFDLGKIGHLVSRTSFTTENNVQGFDLGNVPVEPNFPNVPVAAAAYDGLAGGYRQNEIEQLDYNGDFGALSVLAGGFYLHDIYPQTFNIGYSGAPVANPTDTVTTQTSDAWAAYLEGRYHVGRFYLTVGGRYAVEEKSLFSPVYAVGGAFLPSGSNCYFSNGTANPLCNSGPFRVRSTAFTPSASLRYNIDSGTNVYASFSEGFKAPLIDFSPPYNALRPEKSTGYEIGLKSVQGSFRVEVAGFYTIVKDAQVSALNPLLPSATVLVQNAGGENIYGVDAALAYKFSNIPLNIRVSGEWLHSRYTDFPNATDAIVLPNGLTTSVLADWTGRQTIRSPEFSGSLGADYTLQVAGGSLVTSATVEAQTSQEPSMGSYQCARVSHNAAGGDIPFVAGTQGYCAAGTNTQSPGRFVDPAYAVANGQVAWTDPTGRYTFTLYCNNVTDTRYSLINRGYFYGNVKIFNKPRQVGVQASVKF